MGLAEDGVGITFDDSNIAVDVEVITILNDIQEKIISGEIMVPATLDEIDAFVTANHYES